MTKKVMKIVGKS